MAQAEFDRVADSYAALHAASISASGETPEFFARYKVVDAAREARRRGIAVRSVLDFGSGIGNALPHFVEAFPGATITCADVSTRSLEVSRERFPDAPAKYVSIEREALPLPDASVDLAFTACVFHHIAHAEHPSWLAEMRRVTRPGGLVLVFEHNPLNPLTRAAVRACPFDENAVLVRPPELRRALASAGLREVALVYRLFFPHALAFARPLERALGWLPLGAQYFVAGVV